MAAAATDTLAKALHAVQKEAPKLQKDSINPHFKNKYVGLDSLVPVVLPIANKHGLVILQPPSTVDGAPALTTRLIHAASGESIEYTMPLLLDKQNSQGLGSAITYARRYSLMAVLGLVADEDDDGQAASRTQVASSAPQATTPVAEPVAAGGDGGGFF